MFIKLPILKEINTGVEDVHGETFESTAVINTDHVEMFYGDTDETTHIFFTSGTNAIVLMTEDELEAVFDQYEIKIYDN